MTGIAETTTPTVWLDLPDAPPVPGLRFRGIPRPVGLRADVGRHVRGRQRGRHPLAPDGRPLRIENEGDDGSRRLTTSSSRRSTASPSRSPGPTGSSATDVPTYEIWGYIDPAARRRGIGRRCSPGTSPACTRRAAAIDAGLPVVIGAHAEDGQEGDRILAETNGFEPVRTFYPDASRPLGADPGRAAAGRDRAPAGHRRTQHRAIFDAEVEAFRDHWGHREGSEHGFEATSLARSSTRSLWAVAWAGDEVAGVVENWIWADENAQLGVERGWLEKVSVRRPWRRRGLARR